MNGNKYFVCTYTFTLQFLLVIESCCDLCKYGIFIDLYETTIALKIVLITSSRQIQNVLDYRSTNT